MKLCNICIVTMRIYIYIYVCMYIYKRDHHNNHDTNSCKFFFLFLSNLTPPI